MHLNAAEWARIEALFPQLAELPGPERLAFLDRECANEPRVRCELEAMIAAAETEDGLLDRQVGLSSTESKPAADDLPAGTRMGSWKIKAPIGHGGMGEVYLAERADGAYAMSAAIKLLKKELFSYANAQRFLRERRVLARLSHPNIARVLDAGTTDDGRPFLVMEYVHGTRVTDYARARSLPPDAAARLMLAVAEAVAEAHRRGVVHRDLKPANVMVDDEQQVKVLDFGIARLLDEDDTATGLVALTPAYAAPEQIRGDPPLPAADVYALGVMLFQLLTQRLPHAREGLPLPVIAAGLDGEAPEAPSRVVLASNGLFPTAERARRADAIAGDLDTIVLKALRTNPSRRYADAGELAEALRRFLARYADTRAGAVSAARRWLERLIAPPAAVAAGEQKYWAFISYSHADEPWARWLHGAIETWRVPRRLVGRPLGDETIPRRLLPVFRDRDELPSSHELGAVINQALRASRNLVVICSPRAATSRWVNEEVKAFRALGRSDRVFCLIVDGEPNASERPEIAFSECFPPALREAGFEPIAADARARKDGKAGARLKLLAGILGVGLDELKQREKQRERRRRVLAALSVTAIVGLLAGSWQWFAAQRQAREQEILVEQLVESGRQELLDARQARAAVYLTEALRLGADTIPVRFMLGQAMQPIDAMTGVRIDHGGTVLRAAFSPDGTRIAMAVLGKDKAVVGKIYDAATGRLTGTLRGLPQGPRVFQFFPDGRRLLVNGNRDRDTVNHVEAGPVTGIWELEHEAPVLLAEGMLGRIGEQVAPEGARFITPNAGGGIALWDTQRAQRLGVIAAGRTIAAAGLSRDGRKLALADAEGRVEVWDAGSRQRLGQLQGSEGLAAAGVLFYADASQLVLLSDAGDVRIWSLGANTLRLAFLADPRTILDARLSRDGRRLLTVGREGYKVWSTSRGLMAFSINRYLLASAMATLTPDGNFLYTADDESPVGEFWGVLSKTRLYTLDFHSERLTYVAVDPQGQRVLTASADGRAEISRADVKLKWGEELTSDPRIVRFSRDGKTLLIAGGTDDAGRLELVTGEQRTTLAAHGATVRQAEFGSNGRLLSTSDDGSALWWTAQSPPEPSPLRRGTTPVHLARIGPDGRRAVTADGFYDALGANEPAPPRCTLWDLEHPRELAVLPHDAAVYSAAFTKDGRRLATGDLKGAVKIWSASDGALERALSGHGAVVQSLAFSPDGTRLYTAADDKVVKAWDVDSGEQVAALQNPALGVPSHLAYNAPDGTVAIATEEGTIWLWTPATGTTRTLTGHGNLVLAVQFLQGGTLLLSTSGDGSARVWDVARGTELARVAANRFAIYSHDVSLGEARLATSSNERFVGIWDIAAERRAPDALAEALRCRVPWQLRDTSLEARAATPEGCAAR